MLIAVLPCRAQALDTEVGQCQAGTEAVWPELHARALAGLVIDHHLDARPPESIDALVLVVRECLQQLVLAVEVLDLARSVLGLVVPHQLSRVPRPRVKRIAFDDPYGGPLQNVVSHMPIHVFFRFLRREVLEGEFASHEGTRFVAGCDTLRPSDGWQVDPPVVIAALVAEGENGAALDIRRPVENHNRSIAVAWHFEPR